MFCHGTLEQRLELDGTFRMLDPPADHAAAIDVEDDVEMEAGPFDRPHQLGDVPGPYLVGCLGQKLGLLIDRVATLEAAFCNFALSRQYPIHRADRAKIVAFIEQGGKDLGQPLGSGSGWRSGGMQMGKHPNSFTFQQGTRDRRPQFFRERRCSQRHTMPMHAGP